MIIKAKNFYWLLNALILGGVLILYAHLKMPESEAYTVCIFKNITGLPCPGCGLVRAMGAMLHMDILQAIKHNTLSPIVFLVVLSIMPWQLYDLLKRKGTMYYTFIDVNTVLKERRYFIAVMSMIAISWAVTLSRHFNLL